MCSRTTFQWYDLPINHLHESGCTCENQARWCIINAMNLTVFTLGERGLHIRESERVEKGPALIVRKVMDLFLCIIILTS